MHAEAIVFVFLSLAVMVNIVTFVLCVQCIDFIVVSLNSDSFLVNAIQKNVSKKIIIILLLIFGRFIPLLFVCS